MTDLLLNLLNCFNFQGILDDINLVQIENLTYDFLF